MRELWDWLDWLVVRISFAVRPYDTVAARRRWFWQPHTLRAPLMVEADEDFCCALDYGHDGPCGVICDVCAGSGECPVCLGDGPELAGCPECDTTGSCPVRCDEGMKYEDPI